ncbi:MAG: BNR-4 repeat-containing protein [Acidobacteria bacterium]|nr:BNR-4 repeat-containing protein [Acidobacteriota bacterium]
MLTRLALFALLVSALPAQTRIDIAPVWAGHPVGFALLTHGNQQFVAFYDADRHMSVAVRKLNSKQWSIVRLPSDVKWDSHNYVTMAIDRAGHIHLSGNMHVVPLIYFRTKKPLDIATFEQIPSMVGRNETRCTYPHWLRNANGDLLFTYRDGRSGSGDQILNIYDEKTQTWRRLLDTPLTDGQGRMNAYFVGPVLGPDGFYHLVWTWRDTPDCSSNHDLSYARSRDLVHWESSSGQPFSLPIRVETAEIIDRVPVQGGMINGNTKIGFDAKGRVIVTYHKFDARGFTQIITARRDPQGWRLTTVSNWSYRWYFQGGGAIPFEITHGAVQPAAPGKLSLEFQHPQAGRGLWLLDEETHAILETKPLATAEPTPEGLRMNTAQDSGHPPKGRSYTLEWQTLGANRDRPREGLLPPPSMLRVVEHQNSR